MYIFLTYKFDRWWRVIFLKDNDNQINGIFFCEKIDKYHVLLDSENEKQLMNPYTRRLQQVKEKYTLRLIYTIMRLEEYTIEKKVRIYDPPSSNKSDNSNTSFVSHLFGVNKSSSNNSSSKILKNGGNNSNTSVVPHPFRVNESSNNSSSKMLRNGKNSNTSVVPHPARVNEFKRNTFSSFTPFVRRFATSTLQSIGLGLNTLNTKMITSKPNKVPKKKVIVLVFNPKRYGYRGAWEFPGGLYDALKENNLEETAIRELREELNFQIKSELTLFTVSNIQGNRATYIAELNVPSSHTDRVNLFKNRSTPGENTDYGFLMRLDNGNYKITDYSGNMKNEQFIFPIVYKQLNCYFNDRNYPRPSVKPNTRTFSGPKGPIKPAGFVLPVAYI